MLSLFLVVLSCDLTTLVTSISVEKVAQVPSTSHCDLFYKGLSGTGSDPHSINLTVQLNATYVRRYVFWNGVEPELKHLDETLSVEKLRRNPKTLIYDWADSLHWGWADDQVHSLVKAGLEPLIEIGEGTFYGLPKYNGTLADPSVIGIDLYLAYQYRFCRAAVRRYKAHCKLWQIENELNEAFLSGFFGQRLIAPVWGNWSFLTQLLSTIKQAVHDEDASAKVTMNFHTDVPKLVHELLHLQGYYLDAVADWKDLLNVISLDAYPNMYISDPTRGTIVGSRVGEVVRQLNNTKPVFIMETGYPVDAPSNHPNVSVLNFSYANQAAYIDISFDSVVKEGGCGYLFFKMTPTPGITAPPGGYTPQDESMMREIRNFLETGDTAKLIAWLLGPGDLNEVLTRASYFLHLAHEGWGIIDGSGNPLPGYWALKGKFSNI